MLTLWTMIQDAFFWIVEQILKLVESALSLIDFGTFTLNPCQHGLSSEIMNILGLIGLGEAVAIIVSAAGIRLLMQLIPFTRLGS